MLPLQACALWWDSVFLFSTASQWELRMQSRSRICKCRVFQTEVRSENHAKILWKKQNAWCNSKFYKESSIKWSKNAFNSVQFIIHLLGVVRHMLQYFFIIIIQNTEIKKQKHADCVRFYNHLYFVWLYELFIY
jgi:hypothetical protein